MFWQVSVADLRPTIMPTPPDAVLNDLQTATAQPGTESAALSVQVCLIIPAYQPAQALVELVAQLQTELQRRGLSAAIVIVDDGSAHDRGPIFAQIRRDPDVIVVRHAINLGKGSALKTGINFALVRFPALLGLITADADGQHLAKDVAAVARALCDAPQELILGVRDFDGDTPLRSRLGNVVTRTVFRALTHRRLADTQTGLRGLPIAVAQRLLRMTDSGYELELASLYAETRRGTAVRQIPITTVYEPGNPSSHFDPLFDSLRIYFVFLRYSALSLVSAAADYLLFFLLYRSTGLLLLSVIGGRLLIGWIYFIIARRRVFLSHGDLRRQVPLFVALLAASAIASYGLVTVLVLVFLLPVPLAKVVADLMLFFANFALQRVFVFSREE